ncbi:large subunit ribosomal protein L25 [Desulfosarcina sp. BuS5]|uniref:50S ribosomal protein L25 n=1 Tax=Desulfosarcina sp. BuS5 TaxID=933262 RepID=UPI0004893CB5|nr:50S ribosomal protein L25 [Desulfosarcina sp. BuS5]WDN90552.1 large subunit ribosomal protein L25 [Desulfosarcina sp. BuS5]
MDFVELKANIRKTSGSGVARTLRSAGKVPGVLYGPSVDPILLSLDVNELETSLKKGKMGMSIYNLAIQNGNTTNRSAMIKELQTDPITRMFLHVDFYEIALDRKIKVNVPLIPIGKSKGVELGGILQVIRRELEVFCLPNEVPNSIEIDVTDLEIGDSVHVEDISLDGGIEIPAEVNFTVITVIGARVDEELEEEAEEVEGEGAEEGDASESKGDE